MRALGFATVLTFATIQTFAAACTAQKPHVLSPEDLKARGDQQVGSLEAGTLASLASLADQQLASVLTGSCPVGLLVRQQARSPMLFTGTSRALHPAYTIDVQLFRGKQIREVSVALVGPTGPHVELAANDSSPLDSREIFVLERVQNAKVNTRRLTAVRWVDVVSITYTDGTSWQPKHQQTCRVAPQGVWLL